MQSSATNTRPLTVHRLSNENDFIRLKEAWNSLAEQTNPRSIFLRHEWFDAAWQWLKEDRELYIISVLAGQEIIGICPLVRHTSIVRKMQVRCLEYLNIPDTQECDILAVPEHRHAIAEAILTYLRTTDSAWDLLDLRNIPPDSPTLETIAQAALACKLPHQKKPYETNPGISLQGSWQTFYSRRSRRLKKGNNHVANRLRRSGIALDIQHLNGHNKQDTATAALLKAITTISQNSWKKTTRLTLENPGPKAFIKRLTEHAHHNGWLSLWMLSLNGQPAAMEYQLRYQGIVSALRADFSQEFDEFSPGTYLNWKILEALFESDMEYYAMGPGKNDYKLRWAEEFPNLYRMVIYNRTPRGRLLGGIDLRLQPFLDTLQKKITSS